jgi:tRNA splicing endonuclease
MSNLYEKTDTASSTTLSDEERNDVVRRHFEKKGYRVHSGLQFGCELVLYADTPERVHSDFCVHVVPASTYEDGNTMTKFEIQNFELC